MTWIETTDTKLEGRGVVPAVDGSIVLAAWTTTTKPAEETAREAAIATGSRVTGSCFYIIGCKQAPESREYIWGAGAGALCGAASAIELYHCGKSSPPPPQGTSTQTRE